MEELNDEKFFNNIFLVSCMSFPLNISHAENDSDCLCIASETVKKYCEQEKLGFPKSENRINQEAIARRDIQRLINQSIDTDIAKDAEARSSIETENLTIKELDGETRSAAQIGASVNSYQGILRVSGATKISVECLTLKGKEAQTLGNRSSDFQPTKSAPSSVKPIPISSVQSRTLVMAIPENHATFLSNPTFINTVRQIQQYTKTVINVVPVKGWRK